MDEIAEFYRRWFANRQDPDYRGAEGESEELVNGLRFDVMAFFGKIPIEPRWKELVESRAGDERVRLLGADAGEFMLNSPREVAGSVLGTMLSFFVSPDHQVY